MQQFAQLGCLLHAERPEGTGSRDPGTVDDIEFHIDRGLCPCLASIFDRDVLDIASPIGLYLADHPWRSICENADIVFGIFGEIGAVQSERGVHFILRLGHVINIDIWNIQWSAAGERGNSDNAEPDRAERFPIRQFTPCVVQCRCFGVSATYDFRL
jgi:hypothetical protein